MHPILVRFSEDFFVGTYGLLIALGLLLASTLAAVRAKRRGLSAEFFYDITFIAVVSGFLGARLLFIITEFGGFLRSPVEFIFSRTGFVFLGGLIAAIFACLWYVRRKHMDPWKAGDIVAPALALGHAFGRIGCHFAGCCYGGVCTSPVGLHVPRVEMGGGELWENAYADQLRRSLIEDSATHSLGVWPVQLFESASLFLLCAGLLLIASQPRHKGMIFGVYLLCYSVIRFALEYLRGDEGRGVFFDGAISTSQLISIAMFASGVWVVMSSRKREVWGAIVPEAERVAQSTPEPDAAIRTRKARRERRKAGA